MKQKIPRACDDIFKLFLLSSKYSNKDKKIMNINNITFI